VTPAANAKAQHAGNTWSQTCAPEDPHRPQMQLARLYGWSVVQVDAKGKPSIFQKGNQFVELSASGNKLKVTLASPARTKALLKQYPALAGEVRTHPVAGTALVQAGAYEKGPYRLELRDDKIVALSQGSTIPVWPIKDGPNVPAAAIFDRMTEPGYWPTIRLLTSDGVAYDIRTKEGGVDGAIAQVTKVVTEKADEQAKIRKLEVMGGWLNVPSNALHEVVANWKKPAKP
jgi:hypothetical protein